MKEAVLKIDGKDYKLPVVVGSENERGIDISKLRSETGCITLDPGFGNTGACQSGITYIDGEKGILRYRGIPIEELAQKSSFIEVAFLVMWGELPNKQEKKLFSDLLTDHALLHENLKHHFEGFPSHAHPMAMLSAMINAMSCYHQEWLAQDESEVRKMEGAAKLISKIRTIAAFSFKMSQGQPFIYPDPKRDYVSNLLHMMFSLPHRDYEVLPDVARALDLILTLHADHEQNCSTSTVRMVASSGANLFSSVSAGVCAFNLSVTSLMGHLLPSETMGSLSNDRLGTEMRRSVESCSQVALKPIHTTTPE